jgi:hypothetical protein
MWTPSLQRGDDIARSQNNLPNYDTIINRLSKDEKIRLLKKKKELRDYYDRQAKEEIHEDISTHDEHLELLRFCAKAFAKTVLSETSGYQFYFTEPLIQFCTEQSGKKNFDIFLFNEADASAIFIECKTSISKARDAVKPLREAINLVEAKLDFLSDIVGLKLEKEKIEYVLCIYDKDRPKFETSFKDKSNLNNDVSGTDLYKLWIYSPKSDIIGLYLDHSHKQPELSNMLKQGFRAKNSKGRFELPYIASSHKYTIIQRAIIIDCYNKNYKQQLENQTDNDPKIIKINDVLEAMMAKIALGMPDDVKREFLKEKLERTILYGEKYKLIKRLDDQHIRLTCQGTNTGTILDNIKEKFLINRVNERSEELAKNRAATEFIKFKGIVPLTYFKKDL